MGYIVCIQCLLPSPHSHYHCYNVNLHALADMLLHRWKKAKELNHLATERFETLTSSCTGTILLIAATCMD